MGFTVFSDPIRTPKCKFGTIVVPAKVELLLIVITLEPREE